MLKVDATLADRAAELCKADLVTGMVGEFPELQGVMGRYYAQQQKEDAQVADAIRDHYLPLGPATEVPNKPISICVALADKLDTLVSMFAIGEKPTGSKDPFALRRAALGIIRIILENELRLPLKQVLDEPPVKQIATHMAQKKLEEKTQAALHDSTHKVGKYLTVNETSTQDLETAIPADLDEQLFDFFIDRLKIQLKDQGIRHDVIAAVVAGGDDDLCRIVARARAVQDFLATEDGANLLTAYKRAANILSIEEKKDNAAYDYNFIAHGENVGSRSKLRVESPRFTQEEFRLTEIIESVALKLAEVLPTEDYKYAMLGLSTLRKPVDIFFDKILINDPDPIARENRLRLLAGIRDCMNTVADFALIEGDTKDPKKKAA